MVRCVCAWLCLGCRRYWILLQLTDSGVEVTFHHPLDSLARKHRTTILTNIRLGLRRIAQRVNQLLLLYQLHETRVASPLLVVRSGCMAMRLCVCVCVCVCVCGVAVAVCQLHVIRRPLTDMCRERTAPHTSRPPRRASGLHHIPAGRRHVPCQ